MNIWFVSIFENTPIDDNQNSRYICLVNEATKRNHQVVYWASTFRHNIKKQRFEGYHEQSFGAHLKVKFIPAQSYYKNISVERMKSHYLLSKSMISYFEQENQLPDVIQLAYPPISTAYEVVKWAKKRNIPVIVDIIDPWPDGFVEHFRGWIKKWGRLAIFPMRQRASYVFKNSGAIISISNQYIQWAQSTYAPEQNNTACFYPAIQFDEIKRQLAQVAQVVQKNQNEFVVIYAGSLAVSYDIKTILKAAEILEAKHPDTIKFIIAGDGPQKVAIQAYEQTHKNLVYIGRVSKEKLMEEYYKADIGLTQHIKGATQSVTYKLFDLLASGLPIMNSLESEMKDIILNYGVGFHNEPGDAEALANHILECYNNRSLVAEMRTRALKLTSEQGDAKIVYEKAIDFIEHTVAQKKF